ncbi:hypothetical protein Scep_024025 [Stephania cephalantha]|uniref:Uncharacterized protein n=1 Tax=Stephania cephalantha TaxID=152367 RepID=A0AAP0EYJ2_9MAGN
MRAPYEQLPRSLYTAASTLQVKAPHCGFSHLSFLGKNDPPALLPSVRPPPTPI